MLSRSVINNYRAQNTGFRKHIDTVLLCDKINNLLNNEQRINSFINGREVVGESANANFHSPLNNNYSIYKYGSLQRRYLREALRHVEKNKAIWKSINEEKKTRIFLDAADLIENKYFYDMMAATMVNQGKNMYEAEIDCIQELCDFLRFNVQYAQEIRAEQPLSPDADSILNSSQYLPLMGCTTAITPFNFTAIAGNLATAPLLFGNINFWKPSNKSLLSNKLILDILLEANMPPEMLNFCVMEPNDFVEETKNSTVGAVLFTGSSQVFENIKDKMSINSELNSNPNIRFMGETGGKNFHFIDHDVNLDWAAKKTVESAFNYSGQKCSACSRVYVPKHLEAEFVEKMQYYIEITKQYNKQYNKPYNNSNQTIYGLIDKEAFNRTRYELVKLLKNDANTLVFGGNVNALNNYYMEPTLFKTSDPESELYKKEYFAPILVMYVYSDRDDAMKHCANITDYRLTGSVFSNRRGFINEALYYFRYNCGNFYINDKSTGAVVGQQPFGGFGLSGTNDKAGSKNMLMPLFLQRNIKQNFR